MAKKINKQTATIPAKASPGADESVQVENLRKPWFVDFRVHALFVSLLAVIFYINTGSNEYALDDYLVIVDNAYVYQGFSGIKDIMTKDAYDSYTKEVNSTNQLSGGRYRPLSIASFAIEQQFFGTVPKEEIDSVKSAIRAHGPGETKLTSQMHTRHLLNVLWYVLVVIALLYFLRYVVFKNSPFAALIAAIIFTVHPLHSEVVANIKSRDELMSLFFICCTFICAFKYKEYNKKWWLYIAAFSYLLALLSKEYAIALLGLLPLAFYFFNKDTISKSITATLPYLVVVVIYVVLRFSAVPPGGGEPITDIWNNPYALATASEKLASEIATNLNYLKLLIFPHPLSSDYSYNVIPYKSFSNPLVWLSLAVHIGLLAGLVYFFKKRSVLGFAIAFYLFNLALVSNIFFDIGATMGERLIFHSSVGFAIAVAYLLYAGAGKIKPRVAGIGLLTGLMLMLIVASGFIVIQRNADWKNNFTLFASDVKTVPNSLLVNANLGAMYVDVADAENDSVAKNNLLHKSISLLDKAVTLDSACIVAYINKGLVYFKLAQPDSARMSYDKVKKFLPTYPKLPELYYNLGVFYFKRQQYPQAASLWKTTLKLDPNYGSAKSGLDLLQQHVPEALIESPGQNK